MQTVTVLLDRWQAGEDHAIQELIPATMQDLRQLALSALRGKEGANLCATELINEAYIKLTTLREMSWRSRVQFFALAGKVMRNILLDRLRAARVREQSAMTFQVELASNQSLDPEQLAVVHRALEDLAQLDPRKAEVVELRLFAGLSHDEIARYFEVSVKTIKRDWQFARTWLYGRLAEASP